MERRLIRKFDTPTNIVIVGDSFSWILEDNFYRDDFNDATLNAIAAYAKYEVSVSTDGTDIHICSLGADSNIGTDLSNVGYCIVLTEEEGKKLYELSEFSDAPRFYIDDFKGEIFIGVMNDDTNEFMELPDNPKTTYLLDDGIEPPYYDRFPVINLEGTFGEVTHNKILA
jgi:hypothetical protein